MNGNMVIDGGGVARLNGTTTFADSGSFTGAGTLSFSGQVNVTEALTLDMTGGTVDLDGTDVIGDVINIDSPTTINAATLASFGRTNIAATINTLDINSNGTTGSLTVDLDAIGAAWTLNAEGVMNLVNDNAEDLLLAGSDVNINGTVNVTGDVRENLAL